VQVTVDMHRERRPDTSLPPGGPGDHITGVLL